MAYQFRILSEVSEHRLKSKVEIVDAVNVFVVDCVEDDGQSIDDNNSHVDNAMDMIEPGFEVYAKFYRLLRTSLNLSFLFAVGRKKKQMNNPRSSNPTCCCTNVKRVASHSTQ